MATDRTARQPMVSVAMIAYNRAPYIAQAIRRVVEQRVDFPIELIITDDCSTDGTLEIARQWADRYPEVVKVYKNPVNLGLQRNYLEAFSHCTGRYLAICDPDDYWCSRDKLQRQVEYMEAHPECAITFHRVVNSYEDDHSKSLSNGGLHNPVTIETLSRGNVITNLSVVYRRELVDLKKLPEWVAEVKSPDYALHMLYAERGNIHYFQQAMGVYRIWGNSTWSSAQAYDRYMIAYSVRRHLLSHFKGQEHVTAGLVQASRNILLGMVRSANSEDQRLWARSELIAIGACGSDREIDEALANASKASGLPWHRRLLKEARRQLSKLVPLP